jgi:hypothetical protein
MRQERAVQASLFDLFAAHEIGRELKAMSLGWTSMSAISAYETAHGFRVGRISGSS